LNSSNYPDFTEKEGVYLFKKNIGKLYKCMTCQVKYYKKNTYWITFKNKDKEIMRTIVSHHFINEYLRPFCLDD